MNPQAFLEYILAAAVIVIALVSIGVGVAIVVLLYEVKRTLWTIQKTAQGIDNLRENFSSNIFRNVVSFGRNLFQRKISS